MEERIRLNKERRADLLKRFEDGTRVIELAAEQGTTTVAVYNALKRARAERDAD